jgi:hypothetical protein
MPIDDPILYYTMDSADISGSTITDRGSGGNNGTLQNSPTTGATGKIGQAIAFDGMSEYIDAGAGSALNITSTITLAAWINCTGQNSSPSQNSSGAIFRKENDYTLYITSTNGILFGIFGGANAQLTSAIGLNAWHHVAATYDGSQMLIYLDGTQVASAANTMAIPTSSDHLGIGAGLIFGDQHFAGALDEMRVYNRALSSSEIAALFNFTGNSAKPWIYALAMRRLRRAA